MSTNGVKTPKDILTEREITGREMARRLGLTESYMYQLLNGRRTWNKRTIRHFMAELNLSESEAESVFGPSLQRVTVSPLTKGKGDAA